MLVVIVTCIIIGGNKTVVELPILDNVFLSSFKRTRRFPTKSIHSIFPKADLLHDALLVL
ncbi:hypothetical protein GGP41_008625 [Bipolaris sorokiniana]|uniref:Uncharacterized protein n=1 Tax=Cochliobolus sativus TaxID=45130 RepID=A0A8H5Z9M9_COCSA|nr:hypothetical protein GGP41_008625 [Bipolaris sorokiniana]